MKAFVGAFGAAFTGEHACGVFACAFVGKDASSKGERAGDIFKPAPSEERGPVLGLWECDFGDAVVGEGFGVILDTDLTATDGIDVFVIAERLMECGGFAEDGEGIIGDLGEKGVVALSEQEDGGIGRGGGELVLGVGCGEGGGVAEFLEAAIKAVSAVKFLGFDGSAFFVKSDAIGDLGEVADAFGGEDSLGFRCAPLGSAGVPSTAFCVDLFH